ncbi:hypothetical protein J6A64_05720 [bacterium]|nr:hypothetical protein [bacterium]
MRKRRSVGIVDRLVAFLSYITAGWFGMIYCIVLFIAKKMPSRFVRYNVFQSIFISLLYFVLSFGFGLILKFLSYIPFLNYLVATITFQFNRPVLFDYSLIQVFMIGLTIYMAMISLLGRRPRVFWVSRIIDNSVR